MIEAFYDYLSTQPFNAGVIVGFFWGSFVCIFLHFGSKLFDYFSRRTDR